MEIIGSCTLLAYADDVILLGEYRYDVQESARKLIKSSYIHVGLLGSNKRNCTWR